MELIVTCPFSVYTIGQAISDPATIAGILASQYANYVVVVGATFTLAVTDAFTATPLGLSVIIFGSTPTAVDYSVDDGATWTAATNFALAGGDYTANGPTYPTPTTGIIQLRDHATHSLISSPAFFDVVKPYLSITQPDGDTSMLLTLRNGPATLVELPGPGAAAAAFTNLSLFPTPGGSGLDPTQGSSADTVLLTPVRARSSARLPTSIWENQAAFGTANLYETQAAVDAANALLLAEGQPQVAQLDQGLILNLALAASRKYPYYRSAGTYPYNKTFTFLGGENLLCEPGCEHVSTVATSGALNQMSTPAQYPRVQGIYLNGFCLTKPHTVFVDILTNQITEDMQDQRTVGAGDWSAFNNTPLLSWITSATDLFSGSSNTLYFDALPTGMTLAQVQAHVVGKCPHANRYLNYGGKVVSVVAGAMPSGSAGYIMVCSPPSGSTWTIHLPSVGLIAALPDTPQTQANSSATARLAIAQPTIHFLPQPATFYTGGMMSLFADNVQLINCRMRGATGGRSFTIAGNGFYMDNCRVDLTDGNAGAAGIRCVGGSVHVTNSVIMSGDDALQGCAPFYTYNAVTGFSPTSNLNAFVKYTNCYGWSGSGRAAIGEQNQSTIAGIVQVNLGNSAVVATSASSVTFPAGVIQASGITVTQLLNSYPEWQADFSYLSVGTIRANNGLLYTVSVAGTSSSDPNATGPTGTGTGITDGTVTWNYYGVGTPVYLSSKTRNFAAGTYVSSAIVNSDNSVTVSFAVSVDSGITKALAVNTLIVFSLGLPFGPGTNSTTVIYSGCTLISPNCVVALFSNGGSSGIMDASLVDCTVDNTLCFHGVNAEYAVEFLGGPASYGGLRGLMRNTRVLGGWNGAVESQGNVLSLRIESNCQFLQQLPGVTRGPTLHLGGCAELTVEDSDVWGSSAFAAAVFGYADGTALDGEALPNTNQRASISRLRMLGIGDAQFGASLGQNSMYTLKNNTIQQASTLGSGSGLGWRIYAGANNGLVDENDYTQLDGAPLTLISGATSPTIGSNERYNPAPAQTFTALQPTISPAVTAAIAAAITPAFIRFPAPASSATVPAFTQLECDVELSPIGITAAATITIPVGAFGNQKINVRTFGGVTALTFGGAACDWTNGGALAAKTATTLRWSTFATQWETS